jgi:hypothetical protein
MERVNQFALWSPALTEEQLTTSGLLKDDVSRVSDHLPLVCDFFIPGISSGIGALPEADEFSIYQRGNELLVRCTGEGEIIVNDLAGRNIRQQKIDAAGTKSELQLDGIKNSGLYAITFISGRKKRTKLFLMR